MEEVEIRAGVTLGGRYWVVGKLGSGGFGTVWRAQDQTTGEEVAIKVLHVGGNHRSSFEKLKERFMAEGAILERLDHPNVVRTLGRFVAGDRPCLVTELIPGVALRDLILARIGHGSEFRLDEIALLLRPLAAALDHAHERGVVHRDLKPQNIMLNDRGGQLTVRILDFGVARLYQRDEADATTVGRMFGTLLYMAPEQFASPLVGPASDQFALATVAFELLTLRWAWAREPSGAPMRVGESLRSSEANGYAAILRRITFDPRPSACALRPDLPREIDRVIERAWAPAPDNRYESVTAFVEALLGALEPLLGDRTTISETRADMTMVSDLSQVRAMSLEAAQTRIVADPGQLDSAGGPGAPVSAWERYRGPIAGGLVAVGMMAAGLTMLALTKDERRARAAARLAAMDGGSVAAPVSAPAVVVGDRAPAEPAAIGAVSVAVDGGSPPVSGRTAAAFAPSPVRAAPRVDAGPAVGADAAVAVPTSPERRDLEALEERFDMTRFVALVERLRRDPRVAASGALTAQLDTAVSVGREKSLVILRGIIDAIERPSSPPR